jgi:hypothetical protein
VCQLATARVRIQHTNNEVSHRAVQWVLRRPLANDEIEERCGRPLLRGEFARLGRGATGKIASIQKSKTEVYCLDQF